MNFHGKMVDIRIKRENDGSISMWADAGLSDTISRVEGVAGVYTLYTTLYKITLDKRYCREVVLSHIKRAILGKSTGWF